MRSLKTPFPKYKVVNQSDVARFNCLMQSHRSRWAHGSWLLSGWHLPPRKLHGASITSALRSSTKSLIVLVTIVGTPKLNSPPMRYDLRSCTKQLEDICNCSDLYAGHVSRRFLEASAESGYIDTRARRVFCNDVRPCRAGRQAERWPRRHLSRWACHACMIFVLDKYA
jgi:hypothetical protein